MRFFNRIRFQYLVTRTYPRKPEPNALSVLVSRIQHIDMVALGSDLTWIQGMKIFELALINAIKSPGKINANPGEKSLAELLPKDISSSHLDQINILLANLTTKNLILQLI